MATIGLCDQDRLHGASNYVIWKARICFLLDDYGLKPYIDAVVAVPRDADQLKEYRKEKAQSKRLILDGVGDHIASHIAGKGTAREMWETLSTLYQGTFEQRRCTYTRS